MAAATGSWSGCQVGDGDLVEEPPDDERQLVTWFLIAIALMIFAVFLFSYKTLNSEELIGGSNDPLSHGLSVAIPLFLLVGGIVGWRRGEGRREKAIEGVMAMAKVGMIVGPIAIGWLILRAVGLL